VAKKNEQKTVSSFSQFLSLLYSPFNHVQWVSWPIAIEVKTDIFKISNRLSIPPDRRGKFFFGASRLLNPHNPVEAPSNQPVRSTWMDPAGPD